MNHGTLRPDGDELSGRQGYDKHRSDYDSAHVIIRGNPFKSGKETDRFRVPRPATLYPNTQRSRNLEPQPQPEQKL